MSQLQKPPKSIIIYDSPQERQVRKYYYKFTRALNFPFKNAFRDKLATVKLGKRFKRCFNTKCHTRDKTRLILKGVKQIFRSFCLLEPGVTIPIRYFRNIKRFHFSTPKVRGWRYLEFVARTLTKLRFEFNPITKYDINEASHRGKCPVNVRKIVEYQRSVLKRNISLLSKVKFMELGLYLDEDHLPLLQLLEGHLPALPQLKNIELVVASHRTKLDIAGQDILNIIERVHQQRLFASDDCERVNKVFPDPFLYKNLNCLILYISSPTAGSYAFFESLREIMSLRSLEIWLTDPTWDTLQDFLRMISIPKALREFTFGFSQPWKDFTELIFEDEEFKNRPVEECPARFHRLIEQIHTCESLRYLKVEWACSKHTPVFTNFFRSLCAGLYNLEQLYLTIKDNNMDDELIDIQNLEEALRFDFILESNPRLLEFIETFDLNVPGYALEFLPENLVINEKIHVLSVTGKQLRTREENSLIPLIKRLNPKEDFKLMIGGDVINDFDVFRSMINHFLAVPNLYFYMYEFKTKLDRMMLFSVIKELVDAKVRVFLRFSPIHYLDSNYVRAYQKFLWEHSRAGTIQCFSDATIVSWRPVKRKW